METLASPRLDRGGYGGKGTNNFLKETNPEKYASPIQRIAKIEKGGIKKKRGLLTNTRNVSTEPWSPLIKGFWRLIVN